jgi:hypothetical protein
MSGEAAAVAHRGRVAMVVHAVVPGDPRIARQADALLGAGYAVDVFCLRDPGESAEVTDGALRIVRLPVRRRFAGFAGHLAEYAAFTAAAGWRLTREHRRRRYRLVQVATLPDFLVVAAGALKLAGVPLLLDLHEDMPAFFDDRFASPALRPFRPLIRWTAQGSAAMANEVITVHEPLRMMAIARGVPATKIAVVMNSARAALQPRGVPSPGVHAGPTAAAHPRLEPATHLRPGGRGGGALAHAAWPAGSARRLRRGAVSAADRGRHRADRHRRPGHAPRTGADG